MHQANLPPSIRNKVFLYASKLATILDGFVVSTIHNKLATRYKHFGIQVPQFATNLPTFGEVSTVKLKSLMTGNLELALQHASNCHLMWNPEKKYVHQPVTSFGSGKYFEHAANKANPLQEIVVTNNATNNTSNDDLLAGGEMDNGGDDENENKTNKDIEQANDNDDDNA